MFAFRNYIVISIIFDSLWVILKLKIMLKYGINEDELVCNGKLN